MTDFKFSYGPRTEKDISLWNDARWSKAGQTLTKEQIDQYTKIGEQMIGSIDFETGLSNDIPIPKPAADSINYILVGLRSGLEPEDLSDDEITTLETFLGKNWIDKIYTQQNTNDKNNNSEKDKKD